MILLTSPFGNLTLPKHEVFTSVCIFYAVLYAQKKLWDRNERWNSHGERTLYHPAHRVSSNNFSRAIVLKVISTPVRMMMWICAVVIFMRVLSRCTRRTGHLITSLKRIHRANINKTKIPHKHSINKNNTSKRSHIQIACYFHSSSMITLVLLNWCFNVSTLCFAG
jgi:hypothetical protein